MRATGKIRTALSMAFLVLLASCGSPQSSAQSTQPSYKDTKSIVVDVLKSEDGQKAMQEAQKNQDKTTKLLSSGDGQQIQSAVKDILTQENSSKIIEKTMTDPKFAGEFAKTIQKNNVQLHKDLMKDPDYQKSMLELMNNPEFEQTIVRAMRAPQYRQQMMSVIQESMQSPLFRAQLLDLMTSAVQQNTKTVQPKEQGGGKQGGGGQSGGSGGGGDQGGGEKSGGS